MLHKLMMVRDLDRLRWLPLVLGGSQAPAWWSGWASAWLCRPLVARGDGAAELDRSAAPAFLARSRRTALGRPGARRVVAAIMSTADSFLNLAAGRLRRDLPRALGARDRRDNRRLALRWATVWVGWLAALAVGYRRPDRAARHLRLRHLRRRPGAGAGRRTELDGCHAARRGRSHLGRHGPAGRLELLRRRGRRPGRRWGCPAARARAPRAAAVAGDALSSLAGLARLDHSRGFYLTRRRGAVGRRR